VYEFTVIAAEIELDNDEGMVDTEVEITGLDFIDDEPITVFWDDDEIDIESGDDETDRDGEFSLTILIPESTNGEHTIRVEDDGGGEAEFIFTVEAEITIDPDEGAPGERVTIEGTGFGDEVEVTIEFDGDEVITTETDEDGSFQDNFIVPIISPDTYKVEAQDDDRNSADKNFTVAAGVQLGQTTGNVGSQVTVNGVGFRPNTTVNINYDAQTVASAAADANGKFTASFTAPQSKAGRHTITATDGSDSATATFNMESTPPPVIQPSLPFDGTKAKSQAAFSWSPVTDPSGVTYTLQIATDDSFSANSLVLEKTGITGPEYTLTKEEKLESVDKETPYYWRAQAVDGAGNESGWTSPGAFYIGFALDLGTGWILYTLIGIAGLLVLAVGYLLGRRTAYY
jgi:hypothetical protein